MKRTVSLLGEAVNSALKMRILCNVVYRMCTRTTLVNLHCSSFLDKLFWHLRQVRFGVMVNEAHFCKHYT